MFACSVAVRWCMADVQSASARCRSTHAGKAYQVRRGRAGRRASRTRVMLLHTWPADWRALPPAVLTLRATHWAHGSAISAARCQRRGSSPNAAAAPRAFASQFKPSPEQLSGEVLRAEGVLLEVSLHFWQAGVGEDELPPAE